MQLTLWKIIKQISPLPSEMHTYEKKQIYTLSQNPHIGKVQTKNTWIKYLQDT